MGTTYNPNDASCTGWDGADSSAPPDSLAFDQPGETELTEGELNTISADDENPISFFASANYTGQRIRFAINESPGNVTDITFTFKGYGKGYGGAGPPGGYKYGWKLWIWNKTTPGWELLDSHATGSKDTLTGNKNASLTDYIVGNGDNYVYGLVLADPADAVSDRTSYLYYAECVVTSEAAAFVPYPYPRGLRGGHSAMTGGLI